MFADKVYKRRQLMTSTDAETRQSGNQMAAGVAETRTLDLKMPSCDCVRSGKLDPCSIVIIGASGDLTARKLIPALFSLSLEGGLPDPFAIVGCSRTELSDLEFRNRMKNPVMVDGTARDSEWQAFAANLFYRILDYTDPSSYGRLHELLQDLDKARGTEGNRIFYLAIPPHLYETVAQMIGRAGLAAESKDGKGWSRIVVEKPFGRDLRTAIELDKSLHEHFKEHQIFRIDHYLAKETVQNVLMLRFANSIFEPIWNRRYIEYVAITVAEKLGIEHRAGYYDGAGVLRDMFQNHMMQLLSLIALEPPSRFEAEQIRDEKAKVFRSLRPFPVDDLGNTIVLGQYGPGTVDGEKVHGYRDEPDVDPASLTPTFASMKVFIDNWRWQGVPFYLTSGKRLARKVTELVVQFREIPHSMFRHMFGEQISANRLTLGVYPEEKISLVFQAKNPGATIRLRPVTMDFNYSQNYRGPVLDAYQKVLIDCIMGDHMLFWRQDGVELCWSFLTPILEGCETCGNPAEMLRPYAAGSWGPPSFLDASTG
jgi:glucose-6-phosphate 1-dehydrogenase